MLATTLLYLDPGSGSLIIQLLIGAIAGLAFAIKTYWFKIKTWFGKGDSAEPTTTISEDEPKPNQ